MTVAVEERKKAEISRSLIEQELVRTVNELRTVQQQLQAKNAIPSPSPADVRVFVAVM